MVEIVEAWGSGVGSHGPGGGGEETEKNTGKYCHDKNAYLPSPPKKLQIRVTIVAIWVRMTLSAK